MEADGNTESRLFFALLKKPASSITGTRGFENGKNEVSPPGGKRSRNFLQE